MRLASIGLKYGTDKATYHGYCDFYEEHLPKPGKVSRLLEIGVKDGASLRMWRDYYPGADIIGIDIAPAFAIEGCDVYQMDATDVFMLRALGQFDVIIDDGSHMTRDQQITFTQLYQHQLVQNGVYVMEDVHTSYRAEYVNSKHHTRAVLSRFYPRLITEWGRIPGDFTDSRTMLIRKP